MLNVNELLLLLPNVLLAQSRSGENFFKLRGTFHLEFEIHCCRCVGGKKFIPKDTEVFCRKRKRKTVGRRGNKGELIFAEVFSEMKITHYVYIKI